MKQKTFNIILIAIMAAGLAGIIALLIYTYVLFKDCSIIAYIINKG
ncbi:MAG: hypothetical protein ILO53_07525 [Clostridia bacterium]|nr:hypothetical protein [Clostridia bacterium]